MRYIDPNTQMPVAAGSAPIIPAIPYLLLPVPDTDFRSYLEEAISLANSFPEIITAVDADLDRHAKQKKALRLADQKFFDSQTPDHPGLTFPESEIIPTELSLQAGRPRMQPLLVFVFIMIRGFLGSVSDKQACRFISESMSLNAFVHHRGIEKMPGISTILDNINAITLPTRELILDKQIELAIGEKLDDFKNLTIDSTHTAANSSWPTDSGILVGLLGRAHRLGQSLDSFGINNFKVGWVPRWLEEMHQLDFQIALTAGKAKSKGNRKTHYRGLLKRAGKAANALLVQYQHLAGTVQIESLPPSRRLMLQRLMDQIDGSIADANRVIAYAQDRVFEGQTLPSTEKVLSISDPDAAFIKKGNRNPVIGYKPQLVRSGSGFVAALVVPRGNTADCAELTAAIGKALVRTNIIPDMVSTDDGYASGQGRRALLDMGIADISISGSKGKKLTDPEVWASEPYRLARTRRSAVESLMFTMKDGYDFGELGRRGLEPVREELLEKVLAYNLCRIILIRKRLIGKQKQAA
jgi:IS5 family transposase